MKKLLLIFVLVVLLCFSCGNENGVAASYLDPPFFTFAGQFFTNPGTLNNFISNYNASNPVTQWWNPNGVNIMQLLPSTVTSIFTPDAQWLSVAQDSDSSSDCLLGATVKSSGRNNAKLVDLDPDDQFVSQIFGMQITVTLPDGKSSVQGTLYPSALRGQWLAAQCPLPDWHPQFGNTTRQRAGDWQSVLGALKITGDLSCSPVLQKLLSVSPNQLSIKLNTDDFNNDASDPQFCHGRLRGVIGPYYAGEPVANVPDRMLWPTAAVSAPASNVTVPCQLPTPIPFNNAAMHLIASSASLLLFDLGNAVPLATPHGESLFPALFPAVVQPDGTLQPLASCVASTADDVMQQRAGITSCTLTAAEAKLASAQPVVLLDGEGNGVLAEQKDGMFVYAEPHNNRIEYGQQVDIRLVARQFGAPRPDFSVTFALVPSPMNPRPDRINNSPLAGLKFPPSAVTGPDGSVVVTFTGGNVTAPPGLPDPRVPLDSQVYFVSSDPAQDLQLERINFLVFNYHEPVPQPTWADVEPIFGLYSMLFPGMDAILNLTDEATVTSSAQDILYTLGLNQTTNAGYMPVTRDLSASHAALLTQFLESVHPAAYQDRDEYSEESLKRVTTDDAQKDKIRKICPYLARYQSDESKEGNE